MLIAAVVGAQVALNMADAVLGRLFGAAPGLIIPSYAEFSGFLLAGASFLALAHTFREGGHIRVSMILDRLPPGPRAAAELLCLALASGAAGFIAFRAWALVHASWTWGDASYGMVSVPLWAPQCAFALGASILAICIADALATTAAGRPFGAPPLRAAGAPA